MSPGDTSVSRFRVHPDVIKLGAVSFLADVSSEAIFSVFSIVFTTIVGASAALLGIVEGAADLSASSLDYVSGWVSDKTGKRKSLAVIGYAFSAAAKFFLIIASSAASLASFRVVERLGKSLRGPPRDAWLADVASEGNRGYSYGVHKAMDKAGAVVGPILAFFLLEWLGENRYAFKVLFVGVAIVAALAVVVLVPMREPPGAAHERDNIFKSWSVLSPGFKLFLVPASIFSLAYFSFSFLLLKAYAVGFSIADVILLYALFNLSFVLLSAPIGALGDRIGRARVIMLEYLIYAVMSAGFIAATAKWQVIVLFILFGAFYSIDEAQSKAFIADIEPERRGTAIGLYNFITGLVYVPASVVAGYLWTLNPSYTFAVALVTTVTALGAFAALKNGMLRPSH
jgi:MFS family permease